MNLIGNSWDEVFKEEYKKDYFSRLLDFLHAEYETKTIFPSKENIFAAFKHIEFSHVRVVILGQDPYHGRGQANGNAFAVNDGTAFPPSLVNIYKEIENDLGITMPNRGSLIGWSRQGVLLLNSVLTVEENAPNSHSKIGWQSFTDAAISCLNNASSPIVFLLWGKGAYAKKALISQKHFVLHAPHPSPLSAYRGFFGSRHFSKTNEILLKLGHSPIIWQDC